ncbi:SAM-dependent methyltransferase [Ignicoccus hospitalis]|uniref:Cyclopropane fatty acid synthase-like protein n=1 Tax=Ignicoccus hospitalis (strain KIN4/I / DSM 18386 / JCM 14125) TaxID=453591 RepID=A8A9A3_IGNH4|nr:class I SAM-dependent methyltransferase [Ignicoccus hospitalis]ABU81505.1 Cyclopropane fatty acid synthase-like protein [Ignicoccus hospitalis KIN4/I]HIH90440.1 methyltransferase domain-containing protein [Desulfurococcaceae archaeon]
MEKVVPFIPSPLKVVKAALELAKVGPGDVVYDLGSGDGRVVVLAAKLYGARAVGVEVDDALVLLSQMKVREEGLEDKVKILKKDFKEVSLEDATVVYLYIYYDVIRDLMLEKLEGLRPGARVVTLEIPVPGWMPVAKRGVQDEAGVVRTLYLYVKGVSDPSSWKNEEADPKWVEEFRENLWGHLRRGSSSSFSLSP